MDAVKPARSNQGSIVLIIHPVLTTAMKYVVTVRESSQDVMMETLSTVMVAVHSAP
jgi:hypothetical protein